ncbi:MAG: MotA/TolQ/ExbB proton channel family protein [Bacteroidota bacterium]|nr:MotA/TolQ/ExbB proton channel family protein [Bacteroidota bacterium]
MKKLFAFLTIAGMLTFGLANIAVAQDGATGDVENTEMTSDSATMENDSIVADTTAVAANEETLTEDVATQESQGFHQILKEKFIEGGAGFMGIVLVVLILGLALSIERIIYLNLSTTNSNKLLEQIETTIKNEGVDAAKEICKNTRGPLASIFYQGLDKYEEGIDIVEKSIVSYGGVMVGRLEKGLSWIALFIALAPMLGFMGTVIGMIGAFDDIASAGDISPTVVASGIKVALLTTVFGLIVAIILQVFYNYCVSKIESIVNDMEDSSITLVDILSKNKK